MLGGLTPAVADAGDGSGAITLGVKFQSEISGTVERRPLLQSRRQHRHPRRRSLDGDRRKTRRSDLQQRDLDRLAESGIRETGADQSQYDLRRRLPGAERALLRHPVADEQTGRGRPDHPRSQAAAHRRRRRRRQRPLLLRLLADLPEQHLPGGQLLGRRAVLARRTAWRRDQRRGERRGRLGDGQLDRAHQRCARHDLQGHSVHRHDRADAGHRRSEPELESGHRPDRRHLLHLHRHRAERSWDWPGIS